MKLICILIICLLTFSGFSQTNIDTGNYYNYASKLTSMNWLKDYEAIPIILDEVEKAGFGYAASNVLMQVDSAEYLILIVYDYHLKFGFLYKDGHQIPMSKSHRDFLSEKDNSTKRYSQSVVNENISNSFQKKQRIPENVFVLDENVYWYAYQANDPGQNYVPKSKIIEILRQDIRNYLKSLKKS
jgi:hypothetical protein